MLTPALNANRSLIVIPRVFAFDVSEANDGNTLLSNCPTLTLELYRGTRYRQIYSSELTSHTVNRLAGTEQGKFKRGASLAQNQK